MVQLERRIQVVRLCGVAFGVLQVALATDAMPALARTLHWSLLALLALSAAVSLALLRTGDEQRRTARARLVGRITAPLDVLLLAGFVAAWDFEVGGGTWALIVLLPLEGASRWGRKGAWVCAGAMGVAFVCAYLLGGALFGAAHSIDDYTFALGLLALTTAFVGEHARRMARLLRDEQATREARERALAERQQLDDVRGRLTAAISHEIRTPVTGLRGFSETMLERWDEFRPHELRAFTNVLHGQAVRLERLVCDLLQLVEIERHHVAIDAVEVRAVDVVRRLEQRFGMPMELVAGADVRFRADAVRLELMLQRLVDNAVRHGEPPVEIGFELVHDGSRVRITVADRGPGVPRELEHSVFDRFVHGDLSEGRGLGLSIAQAVTIAHGGSLWYERNDGRTRFVAELPVERAGDAGVAGSEFSGAAVVSGGARPSS